MALRAKLRARWTECEDTSFQCYSVVGIQGRTPTQGGLPRGGGP